jgi:hypothetical protein
MTTERVAQISAMTFREVVTGAGVRRVADVTFTDGTVRTTIPGSPNGAAALSPLMIGGTYTVFERGDNLVSIDY